MRIDWRLVCFPLSYQLTAVIIHFCSWTVQMSMQVREIAINRGVPRCTHPLFWRTNHSSSFVDHFFWKVWRPITSISFSASAYFRSVLPTSHHHISSHCQKFGGNNKQATPKTLVARKFLNCLASWRTVCTSPKALSTTSNPEAPFDCFPGWVCFFNQLPQLYKTQLPDGDRLGERCGCRCCLQFTKCVLSILESQRTKMIPTRTSLLPWKCIRRLS